MGIGIIHIIIKYFLNSYHNMLYFVDKFPNVECDAKTVIVQKTIMGKQQLFKRYGDSLQFPDWFGNNFDAFYDIMAQLYYFIQESSVNIYHDGLPSLLPKDMHNYIDILNLVDVEWEKFTERANITKQYATEHPESFISIDGVSPWWDEKPIIFNVYFRKQDEAYVKNVLSKYSWDYRKCMHFDETGMMKIEYNERYTSYERLTRTMNIRELKKQVYRRANKDIPFWHQINFSLAKWKFDTLYIYVGHRPSSEWMYAVQEVVENEAWIVYEMDERSHLNEISLLKILLKQSLHFFLF